VRFLTDFADLAVLLPLALCVGGGLALAGWRRGALAWAVAIGGTLGVILVMKLLFLGCGTHSALSPSGHTAAGTAVYGGIAALWLRRRVGTLVAVLLAGGFVAAGIGASRVALGAHVPIEVGIGTAVGLGGILCLLRAAGPPPQWVRARLLIPGVLVALALHGTRLQAEPRLRALAGWLPTKLCARIVCEEGRPGLCPWTPLRTSP
jgi:membrane-associated phospholipid phosphatase